LILLLIPLISGCYTRKEAIKKFCKADTITAQILVHDTVITERVQVDTIFNASVDTITLVKDNLVIRYRRVGGMVQLSGEVKADTIYREKFITVKVPTYVEKESKWNKVMMWIGIIFLIILAFFAIAKVIK
jgi:hypothetical protein